MIKPLLDFARRHIILFGTAKFAAGLVIGFALGVYFLPILTEEKGLNHRRMSRWLRRNCGWHGVVPASERTIAKVMFEGRG